MFTSNKDKRNSQLCLVCGFRNHRIGLVVQEQLIMRLVILPYGLESCVCLTG